ncbi:hypothetical protein FUA23_20455 [Neolewinella aurantiaca]|uniref:Uncharacterized protein n=1 Tax=Neolewinella aurantiaca TaxID=2602767 RepID=A0A5C7F4T8_9BACT|nr:hypothetical protein [Neolewinella aurantiaca]TXF85671.1 hypothetical protein FUA23_20455 [Neolewinella aurantiaca]
MNYPNQLLKEHSRANADLVLNHVLADKKRVEALMDAFLTGEYRVVQRSAMVVGDLGRKKPDWLKPWHGRMIAAADPAPHPSVSRNVMRYFSELPLSAVEEDEQGKLLDLAFRLLEDQTEAVAIRVFAMTVVFNFCDIYPELKDELRGIIELTIAEGTTPGFRSRGGKILDLL